MQHYRRVQGETFNRPDANYFASCGSFTRVPDNTLFGEKLCNEQLNDLLLVFTTLSFYRKTLDALETFQSDSGEQPLTELAGRLSLNLADRSTTVSLTCRLQRKEKRLEL